MQRLSIKIKTTGGLGMISSNATQASGGNIFSAELVDAHAHFFQLNTAKARHKRLAAGFALCFAGSTKIQRPGSHFFFVYKHKYPIFTGYLLAGWESRKLTNRRVDQYPEHFQEI